MAWLTHITITATLYIPAICTDGCHNNGSCVRPGECNCTDQWVGHSCTQRKHPPTLLYTQLTVFWRALAVCRPECGVYGECTAPGECSCVEGWDGPMCTQGQSVGLALCIDLYILSSPALCEPCCENGGACTEPDNCMCAEGWEGDTCTRGYRGGMRM